MAVMLLECDDCSLADELLLGLGHPL
jgi:hypothetical protein